MFSQVHCHYVMHTLEKNARRDKDDAGALRAT